MFWNLVLMAMEPYITEELLYFVLWNLVLMVMAMEPYITEELLCFVFWNFGDHGYGALYYGRATMRYVPRMS